MKSLPTDSVGNLVSDIRTWNPASSGETDSFIYIDISSVSRETKRIEQTQEVSPSDAPSRARQLVEEGDVLVSTVRPNLNAVAIVENGYAGATASTGFCVLRPRKDRLCPRYLYHWVRSPEFVGDITAKATGASYPAVSDKIIKESTIPAPPLHEQRRIAAILDKADAIRRKREEGIRLTEELLRSTFLEMFGDPATNPKSWEVCPFGELAKNEDGRRKPVKEADRAERHGEYPYYGASGIIDYVDEFLFNERTLLIAEDGANLLARSTPIAFIAEGKYWVNNHAHVVSDNGKADLDYLRFSLNLRKLNDFVTGSAQPKLNQASLNRIPIPLPPLPAQRKFADVVRKLNELKDRRQSAVNDATNLFGSLVQRAFRGEL